MTIYRDNFMDAHEAKNYGLIDEISPLITNLNGLVDFMKMYNLTH
ncbi:ATP-dependent Clp protease proteolytic subunit [Paenibacillus macquariensis]